MVYNIISLWTSFLLISIITNHSVSAFITPSRTSFFTQNNPLQDNNDNTILFAAKKNVPKMPTLPTNKPQTTIKTMVLMDVENIRGATSFRISHEALLSRIRLWREDRLSMGSSRSGDYGDVAYLEPLLWVCDHGMTPSIHHFSSSSSSEVQIPHNFGAVFAGPVQGRTADDVIVDLVNIRCGGRRMKYGDEKDDEEADNSVTEPLVDVNSRNSTIVITADARLITRCQQARRKSNSLSDVIFVEPASLLQQLERYRINANEEESLFGKNARSLTIRSPSRRYNKPQDSDKRVDGKTNSMTSFKDSSIAMQQHAKFQQRFQGKKGDSVDDKEEPDTNDEEKEHESNKQDNDAVLAAQLKTEKIRRQMLLSDAYYLARPHKNVRGRRAHTTSEPQTAVHAQYKNRNISKKQQKKLYAKRFGNKRKEDMVAAASKRKELAAKLQLNLQQISPDSSSYDSVSDIEDEDEDMLIKSMRLLEKLLRKFEDERLQRSSNEIMGSNGMADTSIDDASALLGLERTAGKVGVDDKWDPLGSTINIPLRKKDMQSNESLPPLRIVVISDTHGFEGALARFDENSPAEGGQSSKLHSDEYLFPQADVLLHCGDFAASGSRKTQRQAARRLDDFLARQTHIPEKIVIQGNHDPNSPAKVLFPSSKAIYVRSSSTLKINGVSFTLEPYSRRMAFRSIRKRSTTTYAMPSLPPDCDVLVSHEPPKGCLDLTYHGFSAGSMYLRELVEHTEHKPRLWLCGHIHESRGAETRRFTRDHDKENDEDSSTIVINASNANSGRANRLVSGAVLVEIERHPTNGGDESAKDTLESSKVDYTSGDIIESINGGDDLASLGGDLEVYITRPGVRRRKGVPQSVRQQMKGVRATLTSSNE